MNPGPSRPDRPSASEIDSAAEALPAGPVRDAIVPRVYVREPGWHVAVKVGSERTFCYFIAPGEDYYHRLADGEVYLHRGDLKICLACADRHALIHHEPKALRDPVRGLDLDGEPDESAGYEVRDQIDRPLSEGVADPDLQP